MHGQRCATTAVAVAANGRWGGGGSRRRGPCRSRFARRTADPLMMSKTGRSVACRSESAGRHPAQRSRAGLGVGHKCHFWQCGPTLGSEIGLCGVIRAGFFFKSMWNNFPGRRGCIDLQRQKRLNVMKNTPPCPANSLHRKCASHGHVEPPQHVPQRHVGDGPNTRCGAPVAPLWPVASEESPHSKPVSRDDS